MSFKRQTFRLAVCAPFNYKLQLQHTNEISFSFHVTKRARSVCTVVVYGNDNNGIGKAHCNTYSTNVRYRKTVSKAAPYCGGAAAASATLYRTETSQPLDGTQDCMFLFGSFGFSLNIPHQGAGLHDIQLGANTEKSQPPKTERRNEQRR